MEDKNHARHYISYSFLPHFPSERKAKNSESMKLLRLLCFMGNAITFIQFLVKFYFFCHFSLLPFSEISRLHQDLFFDIHTRDTSTRHDAVEQSFVIKKTDTKTLRKIQDYFYELQDFQLVESVRQGRSGANFVQLPGIKQLSIMIGIY